MKSKICKNGTFNGNSLKASKANKSYQTAFEWSRSVSSLMASRSQTLGPEGPLRLANTPPLIMSVASVNSRAGSEGGVKSPGVHSLMTLRVENAFAAVRIQRVVRGYLTRRHLWSFRDNALLIASRAIKIQRLYRGHRGRREAVGRYLAMRQQMGHRIVGLYFQWKARRFKKILTAGNSPFFLFPAFLPAS